MSPSSSVARCTNPLTDSASVTSRGSATASPPSARISSTISWHFSTRRAPSATGNPRRASSTAVAAPMPDDAPATIAGRRSGCGSKRGISATSTVIGRLANPRTLLEWTRTALALVDLVAAIRLNSSVSATRASMRARWAPRQKCAPLPKLTSLRTDLASDAVVVGVVEHPVVAVGGAGQQQHLSPVGDRRAVEGDVVGDVRGPGSGWRCRSAASPRPRAGSGSGRR